MSHRSPLELCSLATIGTQDCPTDYFFSYVSQKSQKAQKFNSFR